MQRANLHLAFCSIYDCKTCCLAAESRKSACVQTIRKSKGRAASNALQWFRSRFYGDKTSTLELQFTEKTMANPAGHVVLGEEEAQQATERYAKMEDELQALRQRNEELMRAV